MQIKRNYYNNISTPPFILCKANKDRLGSIKCTKKNIRLKYNSYNELSFTTYLYNDKLKNNLYDDVSELQYIEVPEIGRFIIGQIQTQSEGTEFEYKECIALSEEITMGQKYLEEFVINMGTVESIDGVQFYNLSNPKKSLLHLALEKFPDWGIGHVDSELYSMQRCFEITRQDVYSFLTTDISQAFQCIFDFDTLNHRINVYKESLVGEDTNIFISYNNLLKNTNISSNIDDIKTCLTVLGADNLNLREVNMGYDRIYNLDYFHDLKYMSKGLYDTYTLWKNKWKQNVKPYENLVTQYQDYYNQIYYLQSEKMPSNPSSTNWTEYGLNSLKEKLSSYEKQQSVMIKFGQGEKNHKDYNTLYLPCYNAIQEIKKQILIIENQIKDLQNKQSDIGKQMDSIISSISMQNNFTEQQLEELSKFIREDELSSSNFIVTDTMTDSERMDMLHEMLNYGEEELSKKSQPILQFSCDIVNIFSIPEFDQISDKFDIANYIHICLRDDYIIKSRILEIDINLYDENDFSVTFGNIAKSKKTKIYEDVTKALDLATSTATTVSFNSSNWNKSNKDTSTINKMLADGLLASGQSLKNAQSDIIIDDRGMVVSNKENSKYAGDRIFIGGGQILFSDDDFKTIKTALGRIQYMKDGTKYDDFGLLAQFLIAGYIAGSVIEGNEIIGGSITGTDFNNGNGTYHVDSTGHLVASSADIKGKVQADTGTIGGSNGFTIQSGKLYSGNKSSFTSVNSGVYIGNDGINLGANSPFRVDSTGKLIATNGTIGGWTLSSNMLSANGIEINSTGYLRATNGNWRINADGTATFKNVFVSGVQYGSSFGNISYTTKGTYGNFNNGFTAGTSFGLSGGALNNFDSLVCRNITAENIRSTNVLADYVTADTVAANYATIGSLNSYRLKATKITAEELTFQGRTANWEQVSVVIGTGGTAIFYVDHNGNKKSETVLTKVVTKTIYAMTAD